MLQNKILSVLNLILNFFSKILYLLIGGNITINSNDVIQEIKAEFIINNKITEYCVFE